MRFPELSAGFSELGANVHDLLGLWQVMHIMCLY